MTGWMIAQANPRDGLLISDLDISGREHVQELAVGPELFPIEQPPARLRLDDRYLIVTEITIVYDAMVIYGAHLVRSGEIRPDQCVKMLGKGLSVESVGASDVRWSGAQNAAD
jgi:hypothetical protein